MTIASQDIALNQSTISWSLVAIKSVNYSPYRTDSAPTWSFNYVGSGNWGPYNFNGAVGQTITIASGSFTVTHDTDGTKTLSPSFSASALSTITTASGSGSMVLTTIPRATQPTVSPTSGETGATYTITHTPASSAFYHDIAYSLDGGGSYTNIITNLVGTDTSTDWTPAHTLLPDATGVTAIIRVITYASSGGSVIGTKTVNLPLTVPASVKPTVSSVAWVDSQVSAPDMPTLMGAAGRFVQKWSKLKPTVTSAGAGGSTITDAEVTQNGQTTPSGTAFGLPIALSGSVPYSVIATDSRGRTSDAYVNTIAVTAYNYPSLPTPTVTRTSDAGGTIPSPTGTYLAITPVASVSSLNFSGEKNLLEWQVRTRPVGGSWTVKQAWTATGVSGNTWTTPVVYSGYSSSVAHEVEVSIRDLFGKNGYDSTNTVKVLSVIVPSETVFMDWDGNNGIGLGKYRANGMLDVNGDIYQGGLPVVDFGDAATTSLPGISELATDAETIAGTDATRTVTPHGLQAYSDAFGLAASRRNRIINGRGQVNQRVYVSGAAIANGAYCIDRWKAITTNYVSNPSGESATTGYTAVPGTTGVAAITNPTTTTAFGAKALRCTWSTASTAAGGGEYYEVDIATEGLIVGDVISVGLFHLLASISNRVQLSVEFRTNSVTISTSSAAEKQVTGGTIVTASTRAGLPSDQYVENLTIPATCTKIRVRVLSVAGTGYANWSIGSYLQIDGLKINKGATLLDYSDGSTTVTFTASPNGQTMTINALHAVGQPIEQANLEAATYTVAWTGSARGRIYKSGTLSLAAYAASPLSVAADGLGDYVLELYDGTFTDVQVERGAVATPYDFRPFGLELMLCQRYYEKSWDYATAVGTTGTGGSAWGDQAAGSVVGYIGAFVRYKVPKRATPTLTIYDLLGAINKVARTNLGSANNNGSTITVDPTAPGVNGALIYSASGSSGGGLGYHFTAEAEL